MIVRNLHQRILEKKQAGGPLLDSGKGITSEIAGAWGQAAEPCSLVASPVWRHD